MEEKATLKRHAVSSRQSTLSESIQVLCTSLDSDLGIKESITKLSQKFNIKRRRLYDITNVLISSGICKKGEFDTIIWCGKDKIYPTITKLFKDREVGEPSKSIDELFPVEICVGVPNLTINFLLIYFALEVKCLDIRVIAMFFSRGTPRMKTTLSKLYQISYILCSIGVCRRNTQTCEVVINDELYNYVLRSNGICVDATKNRNDPLSLHFLLNRPVPMFEDAVASRRKVFSSYFVENTFKTELSVSF